MTSWMRAQSLPRFFVIFSVTMYAFIVGFGSTFSVLVMHEYWQNFTLGGAAFTSLAAAAGATYREHDRRRSDPD